MKLQRISQVDDLTVRSRKFGIPHDGDPVGVEFGDLVGALDKDTGESRHHLVAVPVADETIKD